MACTASGGHTFAARHTAGIVGGMAAGRPADMAADLVAGMVAAAETANSLQLPVATGYRCARLSTCGTAFSSCLCSLGIAPASQNAMADVEGAAKAG